VAHEIAIAEAIPTIIPINVDRGLPYPCDLRAPRVAIIIMHAIKTRTFSQTFFMAMHSSY
jgi:hypothetical protein